MARLLAELRRRQVFRVAATYLVVGWLVLQVVGAIEASAGLPSWADGLALVLLITGFPIVLFIAWAFELTPAGLKKTAPADGSEEFRPLGPSDFVLMAGVAAVVSVAGVQLFWPPSGNAPSSAPEPTIAADLREETEADTADNTIAVLAFADLSPDGDQEYFSDGIAEEILNVLVRVDALDVTSRTSAFQFKARDLGIPEIAAALNVRYILEGSVRRAGNTIRITGQLIDAETDVHLWSETYDRPLTAENVFAIQDEIANAIVGELGAQLGFSEELNVAILTENITAYELYLEARPLFLGRRALDRAERLLAQAVQIDPNFARAWEMRAAVNWLAPAYGFEFSVESPPEADALAYAERAISIDPRSGLALATIAQARVQSAQRLEEPGDWHEILGLFDQAIEYDSQNASAMLWRGMTRAALGHLEAGLEDLLACLEIEPTYVPCHTNAAIIMPNTLGDEAAMDFYRDYFRIGVGMWGVIDPGLLARLEEEMLFYSSTNSGGILLGWQRHQELYQAFRNLDGDNGELAADILRFVTEQGDRNLDLISTIIVPLGAFDTAPTETFMWNWAHTRYRQSSQFRNFIRESGTLAYWQEYGFPSQCRAAGEDDFECD